MLVVQAIDKREYTNGANNLGFDLNVAVCEAPFVRSRIQTIVFDNMGTNQQPKCIVHPPFLYILYRVI